MQKFTKNVNVRFCVTPMSYHGQVWTLGKFTLKLKTVQCDTFENNYVFQTMWKYTTLNLLLKLSCITIFYLKQRLTILNSKLANNNNSSKNLPCMESSWRNTCFRMLHCLNLLFTVSCLLLTMPIILCFSSGMPIELGHFTLRGASPSYPSSASTLSNSSSHVIKLERKISRSFFSPGKKGPLIQQMSPVKIFNATSYRSPDEFVFWV